MLPNQVHEIGTPVAGLLIRCSNGEDEIFGIGIEVEGEM